jgi:hypothetical protein
MGTRAGNTVPGVFHYRSASVPAGGVREDNCLRSTDPTASADLKILEAKINCLLPPRYQHCYECVQPGSMGSAGLKYTPEGRVAWGEIWTSFCDLALAGGPPHRGRLLEPVWPETVADQPERHRAVVDELDRAIRLAADREPVVGYALGWVGVSCSTCEEASWLQAAVVAENVSARRRGTVLQLPAGPEFRVEKEVKNVVVALAKVCHYWSGHLSDAQQSAFQGTTFCEPASPAEAAASPEEYRATLAALGQRLGETAGHGVDPTQYPGWIGVACDGEPMAAWLLRATLVEGLLTRREAEMLYLPVGVGQPADETEREVAVFADALRLWRVYAGGRS